MSFLGKMAENLGAVFGTARANLDGCDADAVVIYYIIVLNKFCAKFTTYLLFMFQIVTTNQ